MTSYDYWGDGTIKQRTDARNLVTKYFYDAARRLDLIEYWNGGSLVSSADPGYDDVGNRTSMVDSTGTTSYQYDTLNRMTSATFPGSLTVSYRYDNTGGVGEAPAAYPGQRTKITYPDNKTATYTFEADGRMKTVTDWLSKQTTYSYDNAGRLNSTTLGNGIVTDYTYDAADRLLTVLNHDGATTISSYSYALDKVGNRTQVVDTIGTTTPGYDASYELTAVTYPNNDTQSYSYDAMGNRLTKVESGNSTSSTYDDADELTAAGGVSYSYDNNGNQTGRGSDTFGYDHENRMTSTSIGGTSASYAYNGDGLRTSRTIGASTVSFRWDVAAPLPVVVQDDAGNTYVYGLDLISRTDGSGNQEYYLYDGLGSTTGLTDGSKTVTGTYQYDVFGAIRSQTGSSPNEFKFTGEQVDGSGLQYLRARYYDNAIGRFLGRDPVPYLQRYAYAGSNPINLTDPSGLTPSVSELIEATAACAAFWAGRMLDINAGNPCAGELAAMEAAMQAMLEATLEAPQQGWDAISPYLPEVGKGVLHCLAWGAAGAAAGGGVPGAIVGCGVGLTSYTFNRLGWSNPLTECTQWGAGAAAVSGNAWVAGAACLAGAGSWLNSNYGPGDPFSQCAIWGLLIGASATRAGGGRAGLESGVASCGAAFGTAFAD